MCREARWVDPKLMHLTLVFLGEIPEDAVAGVTSAIDKIVAPVPAFSCDFAGLGFFGSPRSPRVIWVGMKGNLQPLMTIQADITSSMKQLSFIVEERPFSPHLTLARLKFPKHMEKLMAELEKKKDDSLGSIQVDRIVLIQSNLSSKDNRYTILHESPLGITDKRI